MISLSVKGAGKTGRRFSILRRSFFFHFRAITCPVQTFHFLRLGFFPASVLPWASAPAPSVRHLTDDFSWSSHLVADHLGWFKEITAEGQQRTIEDLMRAKGETVRRGHVDSHGGVVEYTPE
jgi:hypothetical protein